MPIYRLVFRIDFEPVFDIFDSKGKIMRILLDEKMDDSKFLPDLLEDSKSHAVLAKFTNKDEDIRTFTVEPTSLSASFESINGAECSALGSHIVFHKFIKLANIFRQEFSINDLKRCGLRLLHFDTIGIHDCSSIQQFKSIIDNRIAHEIEQTVGNITDIGLAFDGAHDDKTKYHIKFGPYSTDGIDKYFVHIAEKFDETTEHDTIIDIDIYEEDFRINNTVSFIKWCNPIIEKANKSVNVITSRLTSKIG